MARNEEIAGISIGIGANTGKLDAELDRIEQRLANITAHEILVSAKVDDKSIRAAVKTAKEQLANLSKTPVPVRFNFGVTQGAVGQLQRQMSKAITTFGGLKVDLTANADDLVRSLGPVTIPVTLKVSGITGTADAAVVAQAVETSTPTAVPTPAAAKRRGKPGKVVGKPQTTAAAAQAVLAAETERLLVETSVTPPRAGTVIPRDDTAGRRVQAQAGANRGIYPAGGDISEIRRQAVANMGVSTPFLIPENSATYKRYVAAGGDPESAKLGIFRPLPGNEAKYLAEFGKEAMSRPRKDPEEGMRVGSAGPYREGKGIDPRSAAAGGRNMRTSRLTPTEFLQEVMQRQMKDYTEAVSAIEIKGSLGHVMDEAGNFTGEVRPLYDEKSFGKFIDKAKEDVAEALVEPDLDTKIAKLNDSIRSLFEIGAAQRIKMESIATGRGKPGKGTAKYHKLVGERKAKMPRDIFEFSVVDVRNTALAADAELQRLIALREGTPLNEPGTEAEFIEQAKAIHSKRQRTRKPAKVVPVVMTADDKAELDARVAKNAADAAEREAKDLEKRTKADTAAAKKQASQRAIVEPVVGPPREAPVKSMIAEVSTEERDRREMQRRFRERFGTILPSLGRGSYRERSPDSYAGIGVPVPAPSLERVPQGDQVLGRASLDASINARRQRESLEKAAPPQRATPVKVTRTHETKAPKAKAESPKAEAPAEEGGVYLTKAHKRAAEVEAREKEMRARDLRSASNLPTREFAGGGGPAGEELAALQARLAKERRARKAYGRYAALARWRGRPEAFQALTPEEQVVLGPEALARAQATPPAAAVSAPSATAAAAEPGKVGLPAWPEGAKIQFEDLTKQEQRDAMMGIIPKRVLDSVPPKPKAEAKPKAGKRKAKAASSGAGAGAGGEGDASGEGEDEKAPPAITVAAMKKLLGVDEAAKIAAQSRVNTKKLIESSEDIRQSNAAILEENPVRALSVAVSQILVNIVGGRARLKVLVKDANRATNEHQRAIKAADKADTEVKIAEKAYETAKAAGLDDEAERIATELPKLRKLARQRRTEQEAAGAEEKKAQEPINRSRLRFAAATLAVGTVGVVAGTQLFSLAMSAANLALEQFGIGIGRAVDRLTGFETVTGQFIGSLSEATRSNYGNAKAAVASSFAASGLSGAVADTIRPLIEQRTSIIAGTKAFEDQLTQLRAFQNISGSSRYGVDAKALLESTGGGFLGIGNQRSIAELIGGEFGNIRNQQSALIAKKQPLINFGQAFPGILPADWQFGGPSQEVIATINKDLAATDDGLKLMVATLNEDVAKTGLTNLRYTLQPTTRDLIALDKAVEDAAAAFPEQADEIRTFAKNLGSVGAAISGGVTGRGLLTLLQAGALGPVMPSGEELIRGQQRQIEGGIKARALQGELQRQETLPIQQFISQLARPLVPFEQTVAARTPGATEASNYEATAISINAAQASLKGYADQGQRAALNTIRMSDALMDALGVGQDLEGQWATATAAVADYGQRISQLQIGMMWKQVNVQVHQYDEQLRVANRSLADAKEFATGIKQANSDGLGLLERQTREINRQSTLLQQDLQQRQINFQVAMAGFVAPGTTPEERAARVKQAQIEADYAQKQLDLSKQAFAVQQDIIDVGAGRSLTDIQNQIALLQEGRAVTIELALDQENLAVMQQALDAEMARAQSVLDQAVDIKNQIIAVGASIVATIGGDIIAFVNEGLRVLGVAGNYFNDYFDNVTGRPSGSGHLEYTEAAGTLSNVSSATKMIVGEAGNETVAILRNPREMAYMPGGGTGGAPVTNVVQVSVTGNTVRSDDDLEVLASVVARRVEEVMGRRASQFGLRNAR